MYFHTMVIGQMLGLQMKKTLDVYLFQVVTIMETSLRKYFPIITSDITTVQDFVNLLPIMQNNFFTFGRAYF